MSKIVGLRICGWITAICIPVIPIFAGIAKHFSSLHYEGLEVGFDVASVVSGVIALIFGMSGAMSGTFFEFEEFRVQYELEYDLKQKDRAIQALEDKVTELETLNHKFQNALLESSNEKSV